MLRVNLNCYGTYTTDSIYQWDLNHSLEITGLPVGSITTIHFTNKKRDTAIVAKTTVEEDKIIAPVPNELLQEPSNITAYVHVYADNQAKTIEVVNIPVIKRAKPDDYQFTDNVDVMNFERLEKDFSDLEENTNESLAEFKTEMNTTLQLCRDTISALQLEYRNLDGGTPTTEEELFTDDYNGGYPVSNS